MPGIDASRSMVPEEVFVNTKPDNEEKVPEVIPVITALGSLSLIQYAALV